MVVTMATTRDTGDPALEYPTFVHTQAVTLNGWLLAALGLCAVVIAGLFVLHVQDHRQFAKMEPVVIRIDGLGVAEPVRFDHQTYTVQPKEARHYLTLYFTAAFSQYVSTIQRDQAIALSFLDEPLRSQTADRVARDRLIETFLEERRPEVEAVVTNVSFDDLDTSPYRATVWFERRTRARTDMQETVAREAFVSHVVFRVQLPKGADYDPMNPLGLLITDHREERAADQPRAD
jgi:type IV secretory pathway TrbF-like protein